MTGDDIREWRVQHDVTQEQLAEWLGYERTIIWRWERGERLVPKWLPLALRSIAADLEHGKRPHSEEQDR